MRKKIEDLFQRKQSYNSMHSLNTSIESTRGGCQRGASSPRPGPWPRSTPQSPGPPWGSWGPPTPSWGGWRTSLQRERGRGVLGGQRLRARGEEVFHCEFARVPTGMGVWIGAGLIVTDPVSFVSPVLISFLLVQKTPFSCFSPEIAHFRIVVSKILTTFFV